MKYIVLSILFIAFAVHAQKGNVSVDSTLDEKVLKGESKPNDPATSKNFNVDTEIVNLLFTHYNLGFDIKVASPALLSFEIGYVSLGIPFFNASIWNYGLGTYYYPGGEAFSDGWFLHPSLNYLDGVAEDNFFSLFFEEEETFRIHFEMYLATFTAGYHWVWENGFNLKLGAGATRIIEENYGSSTVPALEFRIGYAF